MEPFGKVPGRIRALPVSDYSDFILDGEHYYFVPPANPSDFRLSVFKQRDFEKFMADEFGMTRRDSVPRGVKRKPPESGPPVY